MKYTLDTQVEFYAGLGYVVANREETQTLKELGFTEEELEEMTESDVEEVLDEIYEQWLSNYLNSGWQIKE